MGQCRIECQEPSERHPRAPLPRLGVWGSDSDFYRGLPHRAAELGQPTASIFGIVPDT